MCGRLKYTRMAHWVQEAPAYYNLIPINRAGPVFY